MEKLQSLVFLYNDETKEYIRNVDVSEIMTTDWENAKDFSSLNRIQQYILRKLFSKLLGTKTRYKNWLVYPPKGLC